MGRGISNLQKQILGIGYGVNRITQAGKPKVKKGWVLDRYDCLAVNNKGAGDIVWPLPMHLVYGIPFIDPTDCVQVKSNGNDGHPVTVTRQRGMYFDGQLDETRRAKAAVIRAIGRLLDRQLLAAKIRSDGEELPYRSSYILTADGLSIGAEHEGDVEDWMIYRCGLFAPHKTRSTVNTITDEMRSGRLSLTAFMDRWEAGLNIKPDHLDAFATRLLRKQPERRWRKV